MIDRNDLGLTRAFTLIQNLPKESGHQNITKGGVQMARIKGPKKTNRYPDEFEQLVR